MTAEGAIDDKDIYQHVGDRAIYLAIAHLVYQKRIVAPKITMMVSLLTNNKSFALLYDLYSVGNRLATVSTDPLEDFREHTKGDYVEAIVGRLHMRDLSLLWPKLLLYRPELVFSLLQKSDMPGDV